MADTLSAEERSRLMSRIRGKDTKPELVVRRLLQAMGYRFRLHRRDLLGSPDIVLPRLGTCIFVHGCFWRLHRNCKAARIPKTKRAWWRKKLEGNAARDKRLAAALRRLGWRVLTIWECQTEKPEKLAYRLARLLKALLSSFFVILHGFVVGNSHQLHRTGCRRKISCAPQPVTPRSSGTGMKLKEAL